MPSQNPGAYMTIFICAKDALPDGNAFHPAEHPSLWRCSLLSSNSGSAPSLTRGDHRQLWPVRYPLPLPTSSSLCPRAECGSSGDEVATLPPVDLLEELACA